MTKKCIAVVLSLVLSLSVFGCGKSDVQTDSGIDRQDSSSGLSDVSDEYADDSSITDAGKTSTAQMQNTVIDETVTNMLKPLDAIMVVEFVTGLHYEPTDPVLYWSVMYYYLCLYGPRASGTNYDEKEEYLIVGADIVREAGRVLFGETVFTPQIPDSIARISLHDDGNYYVKNDPRPDCYPEFISAVKNEDGSYETIVQLTDVHGDILVNQSFHLTPKSTVNNLLGLQYYYTIGTSGVG